jgi:hypothetical protein
MDLDSVGDHVAALPLGHFSILSRIEGQKEMIATGGLRS